VLCAGAGVVRPRELDGGGGLGAGGRRAAGAGGIEVRNHKLDTVHRTHERLEGVLTVVLAQHDMAVERHRLLIDGQQSEFHMPTHQRTSSAF
jgi:hypothetical protein